MLKMFVNIPCFVLPVVLLSFCFHFKYLHQWFNGNHFNCLAHVPCSGASRVRSTSLKGFHSLFSRPHFNYIQLCSCKSALLIPITCHNIVETTAQFEAQFEWKMDCYWIVSLMFAGNSCIVLQVKSNSSTKHKNLIP